MCLYTYTRIHVQTALPPRTVATLPTHALSHEYVFHSVPLCPFQDTHTHTHTPSPLSSPLLHPSWLYVVSMTISTRVSASAYVRVCVCVKGGGGRNNTYI